MNSVALVVGYGCLAVWLGLALLMLGFAARDWLRQRGIQVVIHSAFRKRLPPARVADVDPESGRPAQLVEEEILDDALLPGDGPWSRSPDEWKRA